MAADTGAGPVRVPPAPVALSTASVYPATTADAFDIAASLGYDGVEVMVWNDPDSQDVDALRRLSEDSGVPVLAIHSPCLVITQRVWGTDPWGKVDRSLEAARTLGARTVVVHPPFRWQREYAREFVAGVRERAERSEVALAVENMFPLRARGRSVSAYAPDWDPTEEDIDAFTLDLSHTSVSGSDALAVADSMGSRLRHLHVADGLGTARDEHLVPGRGLQPCAAVLERLAAEQFDGLVVVEVNTRKADSRGQREAELAESLAFCRLNLVAPAPAGTTAGASGGSGSSGSGSSGSGSSGSGSSGSGRDGAGGAGVGTEDRRASR